MSRAVWQRFESVLADPHVSLTTTHRYAEITMRMKAEAMALCAPSGANSAVPWNDDPSLLNWLTSL